MDLETLKEAQRLQDEISVIRKQLIDIKSILDSIGNPDIRGSKICFKQGVDRTKLMPYAFAVSFDARSTTDMAIESLPKDVWMESLGIIVIALEAKIEKLERGFNELN